MANTKKIEFYTKNRLKTESYKTNILPMSQINFQKLNFDLLVKKALDINPAF